MPDLIEQIDQQHRDDEEMKRREEAGVALEGLRSLRHRSSPLPPILRLSGLAVHESIAEAHDRLDLASGRPELAPQPADMDVNGAGLYQPVVSPDPFEQTIPRDDAVLVLHEVLEKLEFAPCQPDRRAIDDDRHGIEIGDEVCVAIAACGGRTGRRRGAPDDRADARRELTETEWLRDVVAGAEPE